MNPKFYEVIPSAKRLIRSLRDVGYDFSTAVADLIDNSIEAKASKINIDIAFYGEKSYVRVSDNGEGMTKDGLIEAMRFGSEREYKKEDLGKFGLGLKTASMSQCRKISIASKKKSSKKVSSFCWDFAHIEKTNKWQLLPLSEGSTYDFVSSPLSKTPGTVVLWEILDRIIDFKNPSGEKAKIRLMSMCRELETYLGMVFHKFLANEVPNKSLEIYLNKNKILPWDPFGREEPKTTKFPQKKINVTYGSKDNEIVLKSYVLPPKNEFTSPESFKKLSGPANWNQQQGFYIYRSNRMIQSGGWCNLRTSDEHTKLARIELNFSPSLDDLFKINISKMRVQLPAQIKEKVEQEIRPVVQLARERYDHENDKNSGKIISNSKKNFFSNPLTNEKNETKRDLEPFKRLFTLDEIEQKLKEFSNTKYESNIVSELFVRLKKKMLEGEN